MDSITKVILPDCRYHQLLGLFQLSLTLSEFFKNLFIPTRLVRMVFLDQPLEVIKNLIYPLHGNSLVRDRFIEFKDIAVGGANRTALTLIRPVASILYGTLTHRPFDIIGPAPAGDGPVKDGGATKGGQPDIKPGAGKKNQRLTVEFSLQWDQICQRVMCAGSL